MSDLQTLNKYQFRIFIQSRNDVINPKSMFFLSIPLWGLKNSLDTAHLLFHNKADQFVTVANGISDYNLCWNRLNNNLVFRYDAIIDTAKKDHQ